MRDAAALNTMRYSLKRGLEVAMAFADILEREHQVLAHGDAAALETVVKEKNAHVSQFETVTRELNAALKAIGYSEEKSGTEAFLRTHCSSDVLRDWNEMHRLAMRCHRQNQINGAISEGKRRYVERTLSILRGVPTDQPLYGPRGASTVLPGASVHATI